MHDPSLQRVCPFGHFGSDGHDFLSLVQDPSEHLISLLNGHPFSLEQNSFPLAHCPSSQRKSPAGHLTSSQRLALALQLESAHLVNPIGQEVEASQSETDFSQELSGHLTGFFTEHLAVFLQSPLSATHCPSPQRTGLSSAQVGICGQSLLSILQVLS